MYKSVNGQHAAESTMDAFQGDTFKVGIALLTAASLSVNSMTVCIRIRLEESEWSNQRQETRGRSISHMKFLPGKIIHGSDRYLT